MPHIVLVGLPGSGKSTVGPMIAERLSLGFVDLDERIERAAGRSVSQIFEHEGEAGFRDRELAATRALAGEPGQVVAPGGGWITRPEAVALVSPPGTLAWLKVSPERALERLGGGVASRPLLQGDPIARMRSLLLARGESYAKAGLVVDVEDLSPQQVTSALLEAIGKLRRPAV